MQTFLPYPDFAESARCLDRQRLGKQRLEVLQLLHALTTPNRWSNHPAARMWQGYRTALAEYGLVMCREWRSRGYSDTMYPKIYVYSNDESGAIVYPPWLGNVAFHASHRSNLLRKDPVWYGRFGWSELTNLLYVWPVM